MSERSSRRAWLLQTTTTAVAALLGSKIARGDEDEESIVSTGHSLKEPAAFDAVMETFFRENQPLGASLAVGYRGNLVYAKGFGYADHARTKPVEPESLFRIASISKSITATAVMKLVEQQKITLDQPILPLLKTPYLAEETSQWVDPRLATVTIRNCLQHTAGFDTPVSGDPFAMSHQIKSKLGKSFPLSPEDLLQFAFTRPLDFAPGERFSYSNVGYLMLGQMIEQVSGQPYDQFVQKEVLQPLGVANMRLARTLPEDRAPDEVEYRDGQQRTGRYVLADEGPAKIPFPYGAERIENLAPVGGWLASASDLVKFTSGLFFPAEEPLLSSQSMETMFAPPKLNGKQSPPTAYYGCGWMVRPAKESLLPWTCWHNGSLSGVSTLLVSRADGVTWAVLFNQDTAPDGQAFASKIDPLLHAPASTVKGWPEGDLRSSKP
ncbi:serine hydrolase domain-containing protein [Bremerella sp. JC817]|uniref:serine hydrolase domain-containing protein n=1 Tax=Bremerella sp. JC817 TaxID=3231756 RepID=UPI00345A0AAE